MTSGYVVLKDFIPKDVIQMVKSTWKRWETSRKINESIPKNVEYDTGSDSPVDTHNTSESPLDNAPWATALQDWATPRLEKELGIDLVRTYAYSRKYYRNGYMKVHSDRPACEISFTAPMDFKTDFGNASQGEAGNAMSIVAKFPLYTATVAVSLLPVLVANFFDTRGV